MSLLGARHSSGASSHALVDREPSQGEVYFALTAHDLERAGKPAVRKIMTRHWSGAPPAKMLPISARLGQHPAVVQLK
jgi:hypothetical protein